MGIHINIRKRFVRTLARHLKYFIDVSSRTNQGHFFKSFGMSRNPSFYFFPNDFVVAVFVQQTYGANFKRFGTA